MNITSKDLAEIQILLDGICYDNPSPSHRVMMYKNFKLRAGIRYPNDHKQWTTKQAQKLLMIMRAEHKKALKRKQEDFDKQEKNRKEVLDILS